jgi:hypothetical protein
MKAPILLSATTAMAVTYFSSGGGLVSAFAPPHALSLSFTPGFEGAALSGCDVAERVAQLIFDSNI